ncbi:MAG TPA: hypothetical protein VJB88_15685, partial [Vicinamibacteria bacterium]|nr:hypothetical protein [Vicinamibacteria bacterium]
DLKALPVPHPAAAGSQRGDLQRAPHGARCRFGNDRVKKNVTQIVQEELAREVERLLSRILPGSARAARVDLEATEMAVRNSIHEVGGVEKLLAATMGIEVTGSTAARVTWPRSWTAIDGTGVPMVARVTGRIRCAHLRRSCLPSAY